MKSRNDSLRGLVAGKRLVPSLLAVIVLIGLSSCAQSQVPQPVSPAAAAPKVTPSVEALAKEGYQLKWSDEFDGNALNDKFWTSQKIRRVNATGADEAVEVSDGTLKIKVFTDANTNKTGFLASDGKVQMKYGFIEARLKLRPTGKAFMGFWLQSATIGQPVGSPETAGVEIDVCEYLLSDMRNVDRSKSYRCALHWDGYGKDHKTRFEYVTVPEKSLPIQGEWHTFGVLWNEEKYVFYCDGVETWKMDTPVSKALQSMRLSCEVYSPPFLGGGKDYEFGSLKETMTSMETDWVRVWQRSSDELKISP